MPTTTIPFSGFYNSIHDSELDRACEQITEDDRGDQIPLADSEGEPFELWEHINWQQAYRKYATLYAENFCAWFKGEIGVDLNAKFEELTSPRAYNFDTDRIFLTIPAAAVKRLYKGVDKEILRKVVKEKFTSYDGFLSFYPSRLSEWPKNVSEWDHNQIGTLIDAFLAHEEFNEYDIMEDSNSNGELDTILWDAMDQEGIDAVNSMERKRNKD
jgi:hypothetical protein